ncbi:MAG: iron-containing redox enzyme family protein [Pseudomonadota bacterium]
MPHDTASVVLDETFSNAIDLFNSCAGMQRFWGGELNAAHYASLMREIYFHTRENPQIQALATVYFRGHQRTMVKPFLRHAISEVGHDQLALKDMQALGYDVTAIPAEQPLPATTAITAFPFYQITNLNPVGYLGYLYFLEAMPTTFGAEYMRTLDAMGVSREAMNFLHDHSTIDVGHTRLMQGYIEELIQNEADLEAACYAMRVTGELYGRMLTDAFAAADRQAVGTSGYGINHAEQAA